MAQPCTLLSSTRSSGCAGLMDGATCQSPSGLGQKFDDCVAGIPSLDTSALFKGLWRLEDVADVASLMDLLPAR